MKETQGVHLEAEAAVEKVLTGLREVEVPAGLEQRVLRGVGERMPVGAGRWRFFADAGLGLRGWTGALCGVGAVLAGVCVVGLWIGRGATHRTIPVEEETRRAVTAEAPMVSVPVVRVAASAPIVGRRSVVRVQRVDVAQNPGSEAIALREMRAPSQPAPPLPLTKQEKLLLRVVENGAPEEIAMLDPQRRAKEEAKGREEFRSFFEPPMPKVDDHE